MALKHTRLADIQEVANAAAAVLTNAASETTYVRSIVIHNNNTTAEVVEIWLVPDSGGSVGTAADANKIEEVTVGADETLVLEYPAAGLVMEDTNDTIQAATTTANEVTIFFTGDTDDGA